MIIIATGSEVSIALAARELLEAEGTPTRVVSLPCREWFLEQDPAYRQQVLPPTSRPAVSVEAAVTLGWRELRRRPGRALGLDHFGASAPADVLYEQFGLTPDRRRRCGARRACPRSAAPRAARPATDAHCTAELTIDRSPTTTAHRETMA